MRELKNLEYAIEKINKIKELETKLIIESTKRKRNAIEKEITIRINEIEEYINVETKKEKNRGVKWVFKRKNKKIARRKIIEFEIKIKNGNNWNSRI